MLSSFSASLVSQEERFKMYDLLAFSIVTNFILLVKIYEQSDITKKGYLDRSDFTTAMCLVSLAQQGKIAKLDTLYFNSMHTIHSIIPHVFTKFPS